MPYHPETSSQYERFNQMLINIISTLVSDDKQHWKDYFSTLVHAYNCIKNNATDFFTLLFDVQTCKPRLPIDIKFGCISPQTKEHSHNKFVARLSGQLWQCSELANQTAMQGDSAHHKQLV